MFTAIIIILVFGLVVFPYVIAPLVVRLVHKQSARPQVGQVGADAFCPELAAYFGRFAACVAPLGFTPAAYLRLKDEASGVYRSTLKGAFLMSWKFAWPVKQAREALSRRSAAVMLRQLGA